MLENDVSSYMISEILFQKQDFEWKFVAYYSRKLIDVERNYKIYNAKLFAIIYSFCHWRH